MMDREQMDLLTACKLARRTMWIAFVWNDYNFDAAHKIARETCKELGINSFEAAGELIDKLERALEVGASVVELLSASKPAVPQPYERHDPDDATAPFLSFIPDAKRDELIGALLASLEKSDQRETDFFMVRSFIGGLGLIAAQFAPAAPAQSGEPVIDKAMVKRLAIQHGLIEESRRAALWEAANLADDMLGCRGDDIADAIRALSAKGE